MNFYNKKYKVKAIEMYTTIRVGELAYNTSIKIPTKLLDEIIKFHQIDESNIGIDQIALYAYFEAIKRNVRKKESTDIEAIDTLAKDVIANSV